MLNLIYHHQDPLLRTLPPENLQEQLFLLLPLRFPQLLNNSDLKSSQDIVKRDVVCPLSTPHTFLTDPLHPEALLSTEKIELRIARTLIKEKSEKSPCLDDGLLNLQFLAPRTLYTPTLDLPLCYPPSQTSLRILSTITNR
jgi:hypothetical protein